MRLLWFRDVLLVIACVVIHVFGTATLASSAAGPAEAAGIDFKPLAITLDAVPAKETQRSVVLRCRNSKMNVLSVAATDPAITMSLREHLPGEIYVVTATLPAGYRTPASDAVSIEVKTDLNSAPRIRIPVRVWPKVKGATWIDIATTYIGKQFPQVSLDLQKGNGKLEIPVHDGNIKVVVFSAHWCEHCDHFIPIIEKVWKDYQSKGVQFYGIAGGAGNGEGIEHAVQRWGLDWPLGIDHEMRLAGQFGVIAYPVIMLLGEDGIIEAVHGRTANSAVRNGLDHLDEQLRTELDILLQGRTRADFPNWDEKFSDPPATQPTSTRENHPVIMVEREVRTEPNRKGEDHIFKITVHNLGLKPLKLRKIKTPKGGIIKPAFIDEVPPGGLGVICCQLAATKQPDSFSGTMIIESNDPKNPNVEISLLPVQKLVPAETTSKPADK